MNLSSRYSLEKLRDDAAFEVLRGTLPGYETPTLIVAAPSDRPTQSIAKLEHEYALADQLDSSWAAKPLKLVRRDGRTMLLLSDPGGFPLDRNLADPLDLVRFLRLGLGIVRALRQVHRRGLIHKDIRPENILVDTDSNAWLTGFGIASRMPRDRQAMVPPEVIAGSFPYMAPEQTGRMNRSIDARSDLYSVGVTFYRMLTGRLPFAASDPVEWIHCHVARRPDPPSDHIHDLPLQIDAIIMKLLAKSAEDRYQTASGLESDLQRSLTDYIASGRIDPFELGTRDVSDRLAIPEVLYGREGEVHQLLSAFNRVVSSGNAELVLVSGYAGIGKSSIVNELHRAMARTRGHFASGKFDQYKRDTPYATIAQALHGLVRQWLSKNEAEVAYWRAELIEALGNNGQLIVNLIPELGLIIGEQSPLLESTTGDTLSRFHATFRRFLAVFAKPAHPLVLFLDDLQWVDTATIELIEHLLAHPEVSNILLIGAYRDNEVRPEHPLSVALANMRRTPSNLQEIILRPLALDDIERMIADAMRAKRETGRLLATLVHGKTDGNPFFSIQFINTLVENGLITFDQDRAVWQWDLERIQSEGITENVADLMATKLSRLAPPTQRALGQFACLGSTTEVATLASSLDLSEKDIQETLTDAERAGLIFRQGTSYSFVHDRVQEAAYALIGNSERSAMHLAIARSLMAMNESGAHEDAIFDIVNHYSRCLTLVSSPSERRKLAEMNVIAGKRAKIATAYASALNYFTASRGLLPDDPWAQCRDFAFLIELEQAECQYFTGDLTSAENKLEDLARRAATTLERAAVTRLQLNLYTNLDRSEKAVKVGLGYLESVGMQWPTPITANDVIREYDALREDIARRPIGTLVDLKAMADADWRATMDVLTALASPALFFDENIFRLVVSRMVSISLEYGNTHGSCLGYAWLGGVLGGHFRDYDMGYRFGKLAIDLVEQRNLDGFKARVYSVFGAHIAPWSDHLRTSRSTFLLALEAAERTGDLAFVAFSNAHLVTKGLSCGDPLPEVQQDAEHALDVAKKMQFGLVFNIAAATLGAIRGLRGSTSDLASFSGPDFDDVILERNFRESPALALAACWYWIRKLQVYFLAGDTVSAIDAALKASALLWTSPAEFEIAEYHFYAALAHAQAYDDANSDDRNVHREALREHTQYIEVWARQCPSNFSDRASLLAAEAARLEGRDLEAIRLYEDAVRAASSEGYVQNEAIAYELAGRFYENRGFQTNAAHHLRSSYACYIRWGALGKAREFVKRYPYFLKEPTTSDNESASLPTHVDLATVIKMSQTISGEIVHDQLIEKLLAMAVEHAGATRGVLLLMKNGELRIEAAAETNLDEVAVRLYQSSLPTSDIPNSIIRYVVRSRESFIIDDATAKNDFSSDEYISRGGPRSILCLPLMKQGRLVGVLYFENHLSPYVFTRSRIEVLNLLAAQAAISFETARLYTELQHAEERTRQSEREFRQAFNTIPALAWSAFPSGEVEYLNEQWQEFAGLQKEQENLDGVLASFHPDDLEKVNLKRLELQTYGANFEFEARIRRADGQYRRFLIRATPLLDDTKNVVKWYGTNTDIEDLRRAEEELRRIEDGLRRAESELAHVSRLTTMGELTTSIAHEINQPLMAIVTNAETALLWLARDNPDIAEARQAAERVVRNGHRAGDIVRSIRAMARKSAPEVTDIDLQALLKSTLDLMGAELRRYGIAIETLFLDQPETVRGDRVQLQQVIVNLVLNAIEAMSSIKDRPLVLSIAVQHSDGGALLITVEDNGHGIDPDKIESIFEPLFTTKPEGLGMGLSICRSIVDGHGGRLWALPRLPHGSSFQITLPRKRI